MATFREYIASLGAAGAVPEAELDELLGRYEWFALARLVRLRQRGGDPSEDGRLGFAVQDLSLIHIWSVRRARPLRAPDSEAPNCR